MFRLLIWFEFGFEAGEPFQEGVRHLLFVAVRAPAPSVEEAAPSPQTLTALGLVLFVSSLSLCVLVPGLAHCPRD